MKLCVGSLTLWLVLAGLADRLNSWVWLRVLSSVWVHVRSAGHLLREHLESEKRVGLGSLLRWTKESLVLSRCLGNWLKILVWSWLCWDGLIRIEVLNLLRVRFHWMLTSFCSKPSEALCLCLCGSLMLSDSGLLRLCKRSYELLSCIWSCLFLR